MKKILVASILGLGLAVTQSRAQGYIAFDNYNSDNGNGSIITYNTPSTGLSGPIGGFTAALYYELGTPTTDPGNNASAPGNGLVLVPGTGSNAGLSPAYPTAVGGGYFTGPKITIDSYVNGAITFEIVAYNGANYGSSTMRGRSGSFVESSLATGLSTVNFFPNSPTFQVFSTVPVPEPTTIALAGLGMASLLAFRRRK